MSRSPSRNQPSPPQAAAALERVPRLPGPTPARSSSLQTRERVEDRVEIRGHVQTEHLDVVADVADHGQLAGREHGLEPARETRAADAARKQRDPHRAAATSARVRRPRAAARRSRSAAVSTSSLSSGISTTRNGA